MIWSPLLVLLPLAMALLAIHVGFRAPRCRRRGDPAEAGMAFSEARIVASDGKTLRGWFLSPRGASGAPCVIIVHGWGANAEMMLPLARPFHDAGMNVLVFDARNHGESDGGGVSTMPKFAQDALAAADWLAARGASGPTVLVGHSIGAAAALLAAAWRPERFAAVIAIASFAHPARLMAQSMKRLRLPTVLVRAVLAYVEWRIGFAYEDIAPENVIGRISCPVLLVHGEADRIIPISDMERIARRGGGNVRTLRVKNAGHDSVDEISAHAPLLIDFVRRAVLHAAPTERR